MPLRSITKAVRQSLRRFGQSRDAFRRRFSKTLLDRAPRPLKSSRPQIVFVRWDGKLGDSIVLSWVYAALAQQRPDLQVTVLTHGALVDLHHKGFGVTDVVPCSKRPSWRELWRLARSVRGAQAIVHLSESFKPRDFLFLKLARPAQVVGLDDATESVSFKLGRKTENTHFSQKLVPWLQTLGVAQPNIQYVVPFDETLQKAVQAHWPTSPVIGFCPFSGGGGRTFSYPVMEKLIRLMREHTTWPIALLGTPERHAQLIHWVEQLNDDQVFVVDPSHGLGGLFAHVRQCDCIVTVDTAIVHIASGLDKPQLAIYRTDILNYRKWHPNSFLAQSMHVKGVVDKINQEDFALLFKQLLSQISYPSEQIVSSDTP
ncbi:glycosyltransferase family 9 protein [Orrella sp. 11846]|uniref:glycosyltransferase family 9 protein n=1 Tax=Orrella sp. 11846 TaxID=3409913 RepID=UPI003B58F623